MSTYSGCIIGFGKLGLLHLAQFSSLSGSVINNICEQDKTLFKILSKNFKHLKIVSDYKELELKKIDFVVICTPTSSHYEIIKFCLNNNKHVFSEKPLVMKYKQAEELKEIALRKNLVLYSAYMYQFYETFSKVKEILSENILGEIKSVKSSMFVSQYLKKHKSNTWRFKKENAGGGVIITQTSHLIYLLILYFGGFQIKSSELKNIYSPDNLEDSAKIYLSFDKNISALIEASWSKPNYRKPEINIYIEGQHGSIFVTDDKIDINLKKIRNQYKEGLTTIKITDIHETVEFDVAGNFYAKQALFFLDLIKKQKYEHQNLNCSVLVNKFIDKVYNINE